MRPRIWLQATEADRVEGLRVLALQLEALPGSPEVAIGRPEDLAGLIAPPPAELIVLAGDLLPAELIGLCHAAGVGLIWAEAGAEPRLDRHRFLPGRLRQALTRLDRILAVDAPAATALARLTRGSVPIETTGRLARIAPATRCNEAELAVLRRAIGARPVWFAYSLPAAEFPIALSAQVAAMRQAHRLLMIAAPRNAREAGDLATQAQAHGLIVAGRQADDEIDDSVQLVIADAEDPPGLFLRLAAVSYLGGTLTPGNLVPAAEEAASLGTALLFGPERDSALLARLQRAGGGRGIIRGDDLGVALGEMLVPETCARAALQAWMISTEGSEATLQLARTIHGWLQLRRAPGEGQGTAASPGPGPESRPAPRPSGGAR